MTGKNDAIDSGTTAAAQSPASAAAAVEGGPGRPLSAFGTEAESGARARLALAAAAVGENSAALAPSAVIGAEQDSTVPAPSTSAVIEAKENTAVAAPSISVAVVAGPRMRVPASEGLALGQDQAPGARKARVSSPAEGCDTPPSAGGRRLCAQGEVAAAICIVPAPCAGRQATNAPMNAFAPGPAAAHPAPNADSVAQYRATSVCVSRPSFANQGQGARERRVPLVIIPTTRASAARIVPARETKSGRKRARTPGATPTPVQSSAIFARQPILESPIQVGVDREIGGQDLRVELFVFG